MQAMLPKLSKPGRRLPAVLPPIGPRRARVALFLGCVADAMYPETNAATARVLQQNGCEVVVPRRQACCGAIHYHSGVEGPALDFARQNIQTFNPDEIDAIIVYLPINKSFYWLPPEVWDGRGQVTLRLKPSKNRQTKNCVFAAQYLWTSPS